MLRFVALVLVAYGLFTSEVAAAKPKKRPPPKRPTPAAVSAINNSAVHTGVGVVSGFQGMDSTPVIYGADVRVKVGSQAFIPLGFSRWSSTFADGIAELSILTIDTGIGYNANLTPTVAIPFGTRVGWTQLAVEAEDVSVAITGKNVTPFLGLLLAPTKDVAIGFESRLPLLIFAKQGDDDDEDEKKKDDDDDKKGNNRLPLYHMLTLSLYI